MSRMDWREEERLREKVARLEQEVEETGTALAAERLDRQEAERAQEDAERGLSAVIGQRDQNETEMKKALLALASERAAHAVTADRLETQRRITRNTVERAVEMERQRNAERAKREEAESLADDRQEYGRELLDRIVAAEARAERLAAVDAAARELFRALDHVTPGWREDTCVIGEDSDEVNVAWRALELALFGREARP